VSLWLEPAVFPVLLDSCVLYPYELRHLLLEAAHEQLYRVHWSGQILEDTVRNLVADGRTLHLSRPTGSVPRWIGLSPRRWWSSPLAWPISWAAIQVIGMCWRLPLQPRPK